MDELQTKDPDWVDVLIRDYQDKLTCGLYEAIYSLDGRSLDTLMQGQAHTCVGAFLELSDLRSPMELDDFLEAMRVAGPSKVDIRREGEVIEWTEQHQGQCVCPFVRRGVVRLDSKLCICGAYWVQYLFERVAGTAVEVETIETVATGAENCRFRITVKSERSAGPSDSGT
ncbi:MAG: hypothetical protein A2148_06945 [Chloroflexi bacterium RBG_16_68_14]|nr:MAG: hypothetical protein A2148_06945 [Chloroflexi bacterium RBG_16_68_14]